jgi:hypothetical protein
VTREESEREMDAMIASTPGTIDEDVEVANIGFIKVMELLTSAYGVEVGILFRRLVINTMADFWTEEAKEAFHRVAELKVKLANQTMEEWE